MASFEQISRNLRDFLKTPAENEEAIMASDRLPTDDTAKPWEVKETIVPTEAVVPKAAQRRSIPTDDGGGTLLQHLIRIEAMLTEVQKTQDKTNSRVDEAIRLIGGN